MTPSPILKVLSTLTSHQVRYLLMGGQACVLYGAAQFSNDTDIVVLAEPQNLDRLLAALNELQAECIAVPPMDVEFLRRGLAVHFRCHHSDAAEMRVDVMSVLRGVAPFEQLWQRRTTFQEDGGLEIEIMSLPDLVAAKKTQRDRDWPMIRTLVEVHYRRNRNEASKEQIEFWLKESRSPEMLIDVAREQAEAASRVASTRPLVSLAIANDKSALAAALLAEEQLERVADEAYWKPLRSELERLRRDRRRP